MNVCTMLHNTVAAKSKLGFYSVFPEENLQILGIQLRLYKEHTAFEIKLL